MTEPVVQKPTWSGISTDLNSFNAFGVVTLSDGQRANVQTTLRHGMKADKMYEDFKEFVKFLDMAAQDSSVKFWDGQKSSGTPSDAPQTGSKPSGNGEGTYDNPKSFTATRIRSVYDKGKVFYKVEGEEGKFPKFPVTVWPEVLEKEGINYEEIDPKEGLVLTPDSKAFYIVNEKGNPAKVISFEIPPF